MFESEKYRACGRQVFNETFINDEISKKRHEHTGATDWDPDQSTNTTSLPLTSNVDVTEDYSISTASALIPTEVMHVAVNVPLNEVIKPGRGTNDISDIGKTI